LAVLIDDDNGPASFDQLERRRQTSWTCADHQGRGLRRRVVQIRIGRGSHASRGAIVRPVDSAQNGLI
jgi:hypothetical protein